jgi:hypothetical protein
MDRKACRSANVGVGARKPRVGVAAQVSPYGPLRSRLKDSHATSEARGVACRAGEGKAAQPPLAAFSVSEFCDAHRISRALFYILQREGAGPAVMKVRGRTLISCEAAASWRRHMEATTGEARA